MFVLALLLVAAPGIASAYCYPDGCIDSSDNQSNLYAYGTFAPTLAASLDIFFERWPIENPDEVSSGHYLIANRDAAGSYHLYCMCQ